MSIAEAQDLPAKSVRTLTVDASTGDALVPVAPDVADEFGKHPRTIKRWARDPKLKFPKLVAINGRLYASRKALEAWKTEMLAGAIGSAA